MPPSLYLYISVYQSLFAYMRCLIHNKYHSVTGGGKEDKSSKILGGYLVVQSIDILTTFGWAYLMFYNYNWSKDDEDAPPEPDNPTRYM